MALFAAFWQLNCETPARVWGFTMGLCPVSFIFNYFSSLRVTVQSFAVSSLTWESSPPGVTPVTPGVTHLMFTRRGREKRCHLWTTKLKPPDEAERKGAVFTMSTKAQKAPANNICTGWEQRSARLFWRAAAEEMECGFVTRGRKLCLRCDDAARPWLGQLDGGIKQRLRATSVAASSQLCRRFCFASLSIFMAKHPDMRRRVAEGLSACSSEKQCQGEKCIHDVISIDKIDSNWHIWHILYYIIQ